MRSKEFTPTSADEVWNYVKRIHPADQQGGGFLQRLIRQYPEYQLQSVPLSSLVIHDQESDDPDYEPPADPYGRVQDVDPEYAGEVSIHNIDRNPIVVDATGHILDGNHRAWAAAELLGRDTIQAWVPVKQLSEVGNAPSPHQPVRQRKRSAFWANVEDRELVVFFDRSSLNGALQIAFTVDGSYDLTGAQGKLAFRIFSTVLDIIRQRLPEYLKSRYTGTITFTAKLGEGRTAVYEKFADILTQIVGAKYERQPNIDTMGQTLFSWDRKPKVIDEETLDEFSDHDSGIRKALEKKGYKFLGAGVDQMAYLEPSTGYILKIFGTQGGKDFSQDQKMFFKFAKFCMKNKDNPFLPRFYGYESFEFKGKTYLQIRTEQLFKNKKLQHAVSELGDVLKRDTMRGDRYYDSAGWINMIKKTIFKTVETPDQLELLIQTLNKLYSKGSKNKYRWDLHSDNIMVRKDGTPVINDPWVIW